MRTPPAHRATTAHLQAAYPFVTGAGRPAGGPLLGTDMLGAPFCFDPWERYRAGDITGPNMVVVGQIGRGKSSFVKTFVWRSVLLGRRAWIIDPKGEYGALAVAAGTTPLRLAPGGTVRLNPLDPAGSRPWEARSAGDGGVSGGGASGGGAGGAGSRSAGGRQAAELVASVAAASLGRGLQPHERAAVDLAVGAAQVRAAGRRCGDGVGVRGGPTVPDVVAALLDPDPAAAGEVRTTVAGLAADGRAVALELRRLVQGDLAGMFDGPTTAGIDLDAPVVVLDLSALYRSPALGILMICATSWLHAAMAGGDGGRRLVVVDEAWAVLHDLATARWMQSSFKLARSLGAAHVAVVHRLSDLQAAGAAGSEQRQLAEGLLADAETTVAFAQPASEATAAANLLGLSGTERQLLPQLPRGVALWKVGGHSTVVRHRLAAGDDVLVDTDAAMADPPPGRPGRGR